MDTFLKNTITSAFTLFFLFLPFSSTAKDDSDILQKKFVLSEKESDSKRDISIFSPSAFSQQSQQENNLKNILTPNLQILEKPIDENSYILGPNDEISVYMWGTLNQIIVISIGSDGMLIIPSVGVVDLKGCTLAQGKEKIKAELLKSYKKIDFSISLTRLHIFPVYITGKVKNPNVYYVSGQTRVLELINTAGGFTNQDSSRLRGIEIVNDTYPKRYADVALVLHGSIMDKNYYLVPGDRVSVKPRTEVIEVNGSVNYPGRYDFVSGDRLCDLLKAAGGFARGADSGKIILTRFEDNKSALKTICLSNADSLFPIIPDDRLLFCGLPEYRVPYQVTVEGKVQWPGVYPIKKDSTTLREIIELCGGFAKDADLNYSKIFRKSSKNANEKIVAWLRSFSNEQLFPTERSFLKSQILENIENVSLNFSDLKNNREFILQDQDRIVIAEKSQSVRVSGAVKFPGVVGYKDGKNYLYYVSHAGGFSSTAKKRSVKILKNDVAIFLKPQDTKHINPGDLIWVPEHDNRQTIRNTIDIVTIISASISIIGTIYAITR